MNNIEEPMAASIPTYDLIIEAVPENIDIKHKVYQSIEPQMKIGTVLATNTSSLPLDKLAERLQKPERLVGLHFFNPVSKMLVVEVVSHDKVGKNTKEMALAFTEQIGKLPAPMASYPGFLVNRALMPYLLEALVMMDESIKKETIDRAAEHFGNLDGAHRGCRSGGAGYLSRGGGYAETNAG